jgi:succinate dehydrogenase / fumarate reductase membrane anchor subunit
MRHSFIYLTRFWLKSLHYFLTLSVQSGLRPDIIVNHYLPEGGLMRYEDVIAYFSNPLVVLMEIIFLVTVVPHALIGVRSIILDLNPSKGSMRWINWILVVVGATAIIYGIWLALTVASLV